MNYSLNRTFAQGYSASNVAEVHVKDPAASGKVIDEATKAGANIVSGIESTVLDEQGARSEALRQATVQARANAETMAAALGLHMVRVLLAEASASPVPGPVLPNPLRSEAKKRWLCPPR